MLTEAARCEANTQGSQASWSKGGAASAETDDRKGVCDGGMSNVGVKVAALFTERWLYQGIAWFSGCGYNLIALARALRFSRNGNTHSPGHLHIHTNLP